MNKLRAWLGLAMLGLAIDSAAQAPGDRILAAWAADGLWYPARVQKVDGADVHVVYDDGDLGVVRAGQFGPVNWRRGTVLQCNWKNQGTYFRGVIETLDGETIGFLYDDGDRETITISRCRGLAPTKG